MTPQERDLLTNLVSRLRQAPDQDIDREAEAMINDLVREKPDTPYVLAQTVLIQDYALHQAQDRIADLEHQLQGNPPKKSGGFLSALFGGGDPPPQRPRSTSSRPIRLHPSPPTSRNRPMPSRVRGAAVERRPSPPSCAAPRLLRPASPAARCCSRASNR